MINLTEDYPCSSYMISNSQVVEGKVNVSITEMKLCTLYFKVRKSSKRYVCLHLFQQIVARISDSLLQW